MQTYSTYIHTFVDVYTHVSTLGQLKLFGITQLPNIAPSFEREGPLGCLMLPACIRSMHDFDFADRKAEPEHRMLLGCCHVSGCNAVARLN